MMKLLHATLPQVFSVAVPYYQQVFSNYTQIAHAGANVREPFVFIYVDEKLTIVRYQRGTESAMVSVQEYNFFGCSLTTTSTISPFLIHTPTMSKTTGGKMSSSADSADDDIPVHCFNRFTLDGLGAVYSMFKGNFSNDERQAAARAILRHGVHVDGMHYQSRHTGGLNPSYVGLTPSTPEDKELTVSKRELVKASLKDVFDAVTFTIVFLRPITYITSRSQCKIIWTMESQS